MREHRALRSPRRARRVEDRGGVVEPHPWAPPARGSTSASAPSASAHHHDARQLTRCLRRHGRPAARRGRAAGRHCRRGCRRPRGPPSRVFSGHEHDSRPSAPKSTSTNAGWFSPRNATRSPRPIPRAANRAARAPHARRVHRRSPSRHRHARARRGQPMSRRVWSTRSQFRGSAWDPSSSRCGAEATFRRRNGTGHARRRRASCRPRSDRLVDGQLVATRDLLDLGNDTLHPDARANRHRCRKAHLVEAVIDARCHAGDVEQLAPQRDRKRQGEEAVRDRARRRARPSPSPGRRGSTGGRRRRRRRC